MKPRPEFAIEIAGRKVRLGIRTMVMGVLNVTPDSFSDGGLYLDARRAACHGIEMASQGADWIDVGGESTRPGAAPVSAAEELRRVLPVIRRLHREQPRLPISIDTTKGRVAEEALRAGASIVNDISGLRVDLGIAEVACRYRVPLILGHLRGRPATMQRGPFPHSIVRSLGLGLGWSIRRAAGLGIRRSQLIIDPGLGFGKTRRQNFEILAQLGRLQRFCLPILIGASRKSFVRAVAAGEDLTPRRRRDAKSRRERAGKHAAVPGSALVQKRRGVFVVAEDVSTASLEFGGAAAAVAAILAGAHIVRVHSVASTLPAVRIADAILASAQATSDATQAVSF